MNEIDEFPINDTVSSRRKYPLADPETLTLGDYRRQEAARIAGSMVGEVADPIAATVAAPIAGIKVS